MYYQEIAPSARLAPFVRCLWTMDSDRPAGREERIVPDGCMELVVNAGSPFRRQQADQSWEQQPRILLAGQTVRSTTLRPGGRICLTGARFLPHAAATAIGIPPHELTGLLVAMDGILPRWNKLLCRLLDDSLAPATRAAALAGLLETLLPSCAAPPARLAFAVDSIHACNGAISVDALSAAAGISPRQLARSFKTHVGIGPKMLARMVRFQAMFRSTRAAASADLLSLALACGYYDQSHFIRDCVEFSGRNPSELLRQPVGMASLLAGSSPASDFSNTDPRRPG